MSQLIIFLPLLGFAFCFFFGNFFNFRVSQVITTTFLFVITLFSWILFFDYIGEKEKHIIHIFNWFTSGNFIVDWSIRLDSLTTTMFIVVTTVSACVHLYSIGYMANDPHKIRFMGYLSLFTFFMLMLVSSNNLLQMFFGWEGVGLASYLLIGFWYNKPKANNAAIKAFLVNRVGDFGFAIGIAGVFFVFGSIELDIVFNNVNNFKNNQLIFLGFNFATIDILCFLLFIGAMGKSAQLGLHTWLPDAMEGPTPVSALIHAATMVTAGVFMVARMSPLFEIATFTNLFIVFIGASTAIFAASIALTQNDIKRVIAYSTCSQLGYMFFAAGLGAYNSSIFHLMTHGFFKGLLFLSAGSVIHAMHHEQDMRKMGGLFYKIPFTGSMMWIGSLAIIGFPYFSGYYSKESILANTYFASSGMANFAYITGILTALLTAFYSWRLLFLTFHGKNRSENKIFDKVHESPLVMNIPMLILAVGSIFSGIFFADFYIGKLQKDFWGYAIILQYNTYDYLPFAQTLLIKMSVALGIILAAIFYFYKKNLTNNLINYFKPLYLILLNKWFIDEFYDLILTKPYLVISKFFWKQGDEKIIDAYGPNGISKLVNLTSIYLSRFQSGYLYHYAFVMLGGLVIFLTWFIYY
ncbi:MAG: NADH-quinone oxidoreductase subunit L [Pelagibacteraceae bacterium]|nr:NADH-quinone oxidoreductase subunit L [Pelagibacteraceae bacterium]|tara:strand:+ start:9105 stop:11012 length:1908 start_codon:yes stop_codon:yes gene_type:complete